MYTKDDIINDFFNVEGIKATLDGIPDNEIFLTKYSDHYPVQAPTNADIDELSDRLNDFILSEVDIKNNIVKQFFITEKAKTDNEKITKLLKSRLIEISLLALLNIGTIGLLYWLFK